MPEFIVIIMLGAGHDTGRANRDVWECVCADTHETPLQKGTD